MCLVRQNVHSNTGKDFWRSVASTNAILWLTHKIAFALLWNVWIWHRQLASPCENYRVLVLPPWCQRWNKKNSQNKFKIDASFGVHVLRTVIPQGANNKKEVCTHKNLPQTFLWDSHGFSRREFVPTGRALLWKIPTDTQCWKERQARRRVGKLNQKVTFKKIYMDGNTGSCSLQTERRRDFHLKDSKIVQQVSSPEFQIRVFSTQNGYGLSARFPEKKANGMKEINLLHDHDH